MDYRRPHEDDSTGCLPMPLPLQPPYGSSGCSNPTPPPNRPPHQNPIRASAFSRPSTLPSPRLADHSNRGGSTTTPPPPIAFTTNPIPPSPPATTPPPETPSAAVKYRECLRNHAASVGGHVLDGCCEFMPCDSDPLRCAACDCHRSFHRKSHQGSQHTIGTSTRSSAYYHHRRERISVPLRLPPPRPTSAYHGHPPQTNYHHHHHHHQSQSQSQKQQFASSATFPPSPSGVIPGAANSAAAAFGGLGGNNSGSGATTESSSEERLDVGTMPSTTATEHLGQQRQQQAMMVSKKRFRTKFSPEQKEKMMGFAERVGWRMQRRDDVEQFCREVGIRRQVLKVWMHNNKHSIKKHQEQPQPQPQPQPPLGMS